MPSRKCITRRRRPAPLCACLCAREGARAIVSCDHGWRTSKGVGEQVCNHASMQSRKHTRMLCARAHACMHVHAPSMRTRKCARTNAHVRAHAHARTHARAHVHIHLEAHGSRREGHFRCGFSPGAGFTKSESAQSSLPIFSSLSLSLSLPLSVSLSLSALEYPNSRHEPRHRHKEQMHAQMHIQTQKRMHAHEPRRLQRSAES